MERLAGHVRQANKKLMVAHCLHGGSGRPPLRFKGAVDLAVIDKAGGVSHSALAVATSLRQSSWSWTARPSPTATALSSPDGKMGTPGVEMDTSDRGTDRFVFVHRVRDLTDYRPGKPLAQRSRVFHFFCTERDPGGGCC